jgi:hypothetical protein
VKPDLAVTVASGATYAALAELVVPRVRQLLGLDVAVEHIEPVTAENGSLVETRLLNARACCWRKLELVDRFPGRRVLFFDLDFVPLRPWDWSAVPAGFCAVRNTSGGGQHLNGGLWIAGPEHASVFAVARAMWLAQGDPKQWSSGGVWEEQPLQRALDELRVPVQWLPHAYNFQMGDLLGVIEPGAYAAHPCLARRKLETVRALCAAYPVRPVSWRDPATGQTFAFVAGTPLRPDGSVDVDRLPRVAS